MKHKHLVLATTTAAFLLGGLGSASAMVLPPQGKGLLTAMSQFESKICDKEASNRSVFEGLYKKFTIKLRGEDAIRDTRGEGTREGGQERGLCDRGGLER